METVKILISGKVHTVGKLEAVRLVEAGRAEYASEKKPEKKAKGKKK